MRFVTPVRAVAFLLACGSIVAVGCGDGTGPGSEPASITLTPSEITFDAIGANERLEATVRNSRGDVLSEPTPAFASADESVATVSATGLVTSVGAGATEVTASVGSLSRAAQVTVTPIPAAMSKISGDLAETGVLTSVELVVRVSDRLGSPILDVAVRFEVMGGGGSVSASAATTDASGQASTVLPLGTQSGPVHLVKASVVDRSTTNTEFTVVGLPGPPVELVLASGDGQRQPVETALPEDLVVKVTDEYGNGVPDEMVTFAVTDGGGLVDPLTSMTDANGEAAATWTLGSVLGTQNARASAPGLVGSPIPFTAQGTNLKLQTITPTPLVEGAAGRITGTGFETVTTDNTVTVDGFVAQVIAATSTTIDFIAPASDCQPVREGDVRVSTVPGGTTPAAPHMVRPAAFLNLAVGEQAIIRDPAEFCMQFDSSVAGGDEYLVGVSATAEVPTALLPFALTGTTGAGPSASAAVLAPRSRRAPARIPSSAVAREVQARRITQARAEEVVRASERHHLDRAGNAAFRTAQTRMSAARASAAVPSVGDTMSFRVPDFESGDPCNNFIEIGTEVRAVGTTGIWLVDAQNPITDRLSNTEIEAYSDTLDQAIIATDTLYFGSPSDMDLNERIFVVLSVEINKWSIGAAGFVWGGDLVDQSTCPASSMGEVFYSHVPDPNNSAGTQPRSKAGVVFQMPSLIAHEFAHTVQLSRRTVVNDGRLMSSWEMEGQATFAEEVVGHTVLGLSPGNNYGRGIVFEEDAGERWYEGGFSQLARYYGWLPPSNTDKANSAPEMCTLFGSINLNTICERFNFYGASWSFQRYLSDRFGPGYPGGESGLHRDWISKSVDLRGAENVEALLGASMDTLFARWAAMLYVDDRVPSGPELQMPSWNMNNVFQGFPSDAYRLVPRDQSFADFQDLRTVRGGSTAYGLLGSAGARPALALRLRAQDGTELDPSLEPLLWIVRTK
jgi:hypothetical protein